MTAPKYDVERAAALWPVKDDGPAVARCLLEAWKEHVRHWPCERFACVQERTIELAYEEPDGGHHPLWWAATMNTLRPMLTDLLEQIKEARS